MRFFDKVRESASANRSRLCVGLDPDPTKLPEGLPETHSIAAFNRAIVDATADLVCAYKPNIAHYAALGVENDLAATIDYIHREYDLPVILDAKRGDIASTATRYAREAFERYEADAVTVNPFLGTDALEPFLTYAERGVFLLCRTSNPGGSDLQDLRLAGGRTLYEEIAVRAKDVWNYNGNVGLVVGATCPEELAAVRRLVGEMTLLLPGVGTQGGDVQAMMASAAGGGIVVNAARSVLYAGQGDDFAERARAAALETRDAINEAGPR